MPKLNSGSSDINFIKNLRKFHGGDDLNETFVPLPPVKPKVNSLRLEEGDAVAFFDGKFVIPTTFSHFEKGKYYVLDKQGFVHMGEPDACLSEDRYHGALLRATCTKLFNTPEDYFATGGRLVNWSTKPEVMAA